MSTTYGPVEIWLVILLIGLATFAIRFSFIHLLGRVDGVPPVLERALTFVPPAVLAALVVPDFLPASATVAAFADPTLVGGAAAVVAAWYTEDVLWTVGAGMVGLHVARFLF